MEEENKFMRVKKIIASFLCILLCLNLGFASAQFPTPSTGISKKIEISAPEVANVNEGVTMTVTADGELIPGAEIFANGVKIGESDEEGQLKYTYLSPLGR